MSSRSLTGLAGLRRQRADGSWRHRGARRSPTDYDQLATYEALLGLVAKHRLDVRHPAIERAAELMLGFQSAEGDLRGIDGLWRSGYGKAADPTGR